MIEIFYGRTAHAFLRHISVESKRELVDRICQGIEAINELSQINR